MVFLASALFAQSPQQLLGDTAKNYPNSTVLRLRDT